MRCCAAIRKSAPTTRRSRAIPGKVGTGFPSGIAQKQRGRVFPRFAKSGNTLGIGSDGMAEKIVSFVMSGGVGSRLWPLSREDNPKQFHDLAGQGSMLAKTLRRLVARPAGATPIYLIASERHS